MLFNLGIVAYIVLYLAIAAVFFFILYIVINKAVYNAGQKLLEDIDRDNRIKEHKSDLLERKERKEN